MSKEQLVELHPIGDCDSDQIIDFQEQADSAGRFISGTTAELLRDGYDDPAVWLHNGHADPENREAAFLVGRGWSATLDARRLIDGAGFPVMAINDYPKDGPKPWYWCAGDGPQYYSNRIWDDPDVMKFAPVAHTKVIRTREDVYEKERFTVDAPNVHFFNNVNNLMEVGSWLHVPYIAWGTSLHGPDTPWQFDSEGSGRSTMLIGLRLLWHLGYREVYLCGCDCDPHQHPAPKYWKVMFSFMEKLKPVFDHYGYNVYQTNPHSHLRMFDFVDLDEVIQNGNNRPSGASMGALLHQKHERQLGPV
jgi:hypothetical protein